jgi:hypothetical protein
MQLVPTYLPTHWQSYRAFHNATTWTSNLNIGSSHIITWAIVLYLLTYPPINPTKTNREWFDWMNIKDEQSNGWGGVTV